MLETTEVGIIGGGIHGVSAAYHLASRGVKTTLFERAAPASGPTGRSSAICRAFYTNPFLARVARESIDMFAAFHEISGGRDAGYHRTGALFLHDAEDAEHVRETATMLAQVGTEVQLLAPTDLDRRYPELNLERIAVGVWEVQAGYADPVLTTHGLFERARELGLVARLYAEVTEITSRPGGGATVRTATGDRAECSRLLIAAGPWSKRLVRQVNVELPLTVERHFVATVGWNQARRLPYVLADVPGGYYLKPEGEELFLVGPLTAEPQVDPNAYSTSVQPEEIARMGRAVTARIPSLAAANSRGGWASLYDVSPDWQPVIGEIAPGIFIDAGTSGHGFKLAPALGRYVAALVLGEHVDQGLRQFEPARFESERRLAAGFGAARILG